MEETLNDFRPGGPPGPASGVQRGEFTAAGPRRKQNEDASALPRPGDDEQRLGTLLVVADGVGGVEGGAAASREAVQYLQALYYAGTGPDHPPDRLRACIEAVNAINRVSRQTRGAGQGYLTTIVAAVACQDQIWVANVGDSRAYLIRAGVGDRRQLTEDHSEVTRSSKLLPAGAPEAGRAGVIHRAIGLADACQVDVYRYTWEPGDRLVLCTDGLARLPDEEMARIVLGQPAQEAARQLVERALEVDGSDNCTAVVAVRGEVPALRPFPYARDVKDPFPGSLAGLLLGLAGTALLVNLLMFHRGWVELQMGKERR